MSSHCGSTKIWWSQGKGGRLLMSILLKVQSCRLQSKMKTHFICISHLNSRHCGSMSIWWSLFLGAGILVKSESNYICLCKIWVFATSLLFTLGYTERHDSWLILGPLKPCKRCQSMLLRVNPGSLHRSKIHGSMFTFYRQLWSFARNISYMNPNIDNHISCPASLNSQVTCNTKSKLSLLSGVWFGSRVPSEWHCRKYSSVEDYFNFTFGLYQSDSCLQMNTFKIFDNLNYCDPPTLVWTNSKGVIRRVGNASQGVSIYFI